MFSHRSKAGYGWIGAGSTVTELLYLPDSLGKQWHLTSKISWNYSVQVFGGLLRPVSPAGTRSSVLCQPFILLWLTVRRRAGACPLSPVPVSVPCPLSAVPVSVPQQQKQRTATTALYGKLLKPPSYCFIKSKRRACVIPHLCVIEAAVREATEITSERD